MSVGGDLAAELVGLFRNGLQLLGSGLRSGGLITLAEHAARSADLDKVGAVLDGFADFGTRGPGAVGDTFGFVVKFGGQEIVVAVSASNAERRAGNARGGTFGFARVEAITECGIGVTGRPHVSDMLA